MTELRIPAAVLLLALLGACGLDVDPSYPEGDSGRKEAIIASSGSLAGPDGIQILGSPTQPESGATGLAVNSYLWRASLDTMSFMPLASADPFGGVIITDWYTPPEVREERFKVTVYILGRELRADGVRTAVFRQLRDVDGGWVDAAVESKISTDLENAILVRARQLRISSLQ